MKDLTVFLLIVCFICLCILIGYEMGIQKIQREAVKQSFAIYDNQNGSTEFGEFKWKDETQK